MKKVIAFPFRALSLTLLLLAISIAVIGSFIVNGPVKAKEKIAKVCSVLNQINF